MTKQPLDPNTFGSTKAAELLAEAISTADAPVRRLVIRRFLSAHRDIIALKTYVLPQSLDVYTRWLNFFRESHIRAIDNMTNKWPDPANQRTCSLLRNVVSERFRQAISENKPNVLHNIRLRQKGLPKV